MSDFEKSTPQAINAPIKPDEGKKKTGRPSAREALIREKLANRKPMVRGKNLAGDIPEGTKGRWVNDTPGRIQGMLQAGWMFVDKTGASLDASVKENLAKRASNRVGTNEDGSGLVAYLMCIESEIYEIDQQRKQATNDRIMQDIERNKPSAQAGEDSSQGRVKQADFSVKTS